MNEDWGLYLCLSSVVLVLLFGGFLAGRRYERTWWEKAIPDQMRTLCLECAGIQQ